MRVLDPRRLQSGLGLSLALACAAACYSSSAGKALEETTTEHERRLVALENGIEAERRQITEALTRAQNKVAELETVLERATQVVTRNSADLGTEVHTLREQLQALEGQIAEVQNELQSTQRALAEQQSTLDTKIRQFARKAGVDMQLDESEIPQDRGQHWSAAERAFRDGQHSRARALFRAYLDRYESDDRADDAQYFIGKSYLEEGRPASAVGEFRRVIRDHRNGDVVDRTLFDMGDAFYRLHACTDARGAYEALISGYRRSPLVGQARTKLRELRRAPRGYCTS